jgi:hypothetical protein
VGGGGGGELMPTKAKKIIVFIFSVVQCRRYLYTASFTNMYRRFVLFHLDLLSRVPGVRLSQMTLVNVAVVATRGAAVAATTLSVAHPLSQLRRPVAANRMNKCLHLGCILYLLD